MCFMIFPMLCVFIFVFFFFNYTATTEIYTLSLHDALPILVLQLVFASCGHPNAPSGMLMNSPHSEDRKSTRLNSSHLGISYAVLCLQKKSAPIPRRRVGAQVDPVDHAPHLPGRV